MATNAQVALQAAVSHTVALETRDAALYNAAAAAKHPVYEGRPPRTPIVILAAEYKAWLDGQDAGNVTVADLDERVSKLEEK